jgi:hypothetical protein
VEASLDARITGFRQGTNEFYELNVANNSGTDNGANAPSITLSGATGNITANGEVSATAFTTTSDMRLKTDVTTLSNALETVSQIRPVFYNWNNGQATLNPGHKELGFLAQELETVLPNVVSTTSDDKVFEGGKKAVAYDRLVALLIGAVQELKAEVEELKKH